MSASRHATDDDALDGTLASPVDRAPRGAALARGDVVGRYVVLSTLGAGAMGVVYAAHDPELDRKVALKLLSPGAARDRAASSIEARTRLVREAQALAKLSHPNVIAVHDVGEHDGGVWLAMEFVEGVTLTEWLARRRGWREVLEVLRAAGRGLAAAHEAKLLHRDFKPDNVMVGRDGRTRVMDLGLARVIEGADEETLELSVSDALGDDARADSAALTTTVTRAGALLGTPSYMSPEQFKGQGADTRSDVFSFCVTLWEALYGERPYEGDTLVTLAGNVLSGAVRPPPRDRRVPGWLRRVCLRGLSVEPERRYPSMKALLDALARGRARARARGWLAGALGVAALGASVVAIQQYDVARRASACDEAGAVIAEDWSDQARADVRAGLVATGLPYAPTAADKVTPFLDAHADAWRERRREVCRAAELEGTLDAALLDRALWCLEQRRLELSALLDALRAADDSTVRSAVMAAARLPPPSTCTDRQVLSALPTPPPQDARPRARAIREALSRANVQRVEGRFAEALEQTRAALADAEALGWPPMIAAARQTEGVLLEKTSAFEEAEAANLNAYMEAASVRAWDIAADAGSELVHIIGYTQARHAEAAVWARHTELAISFAGDPLELHAARLANALALSHQTAGEYDEAAALNERMLAIYTRAFGPDHPHVADALNNLGIARWAKGAYPEARALHERALAIRERTLGPDHPDVALSLCNLALVDEATGDYAAARAMQERALAIRERALGPEHARVADSLNNLGIVLQHTGEYDEAAAMHKRSIAIKEKLLGADHPLVADSLNNLAIVYYITGAYPEARAMHERALAIREHALGPDHPDVANSLNNLAAVLQDTGAYAEARVMLERALAVRERALGPESTEVADTVDNLAIIHAATGDRAQAKELYERALAIKEQALGRDHPALAQTLHNLGELAVEEERRAEAVALIERAVAIFDAHDGVQEGEHAARYGLARALVPDDRERALALARAAAEGYRSAGDGHADKAAEIEAWAAAHERGGAR